MLKQLKQHVFQANLDLVKYRLVTLTWGNVSGIDRSRELVVIKPSGVDYEKLRPDDMVVVDLSGKVIEPRESRASSDTPTHLALYHAFGTIGGITHTHSPYATMFAQACIPILCLGTTHADHFHGEVPVTRRITQEEIHKQYEANTGKVIIEQFADLDPLEVPAVLVANHGPFTWGTDAAESVINGVALEQVAQMAVGTIQLNHDISPPAQCLLDKHYSRKHGADAYYGQK